MLDEALRSSRAEARARGGSCRGARVGIAASTAAAIPDGSFTGERRPEAAPPPTPAGLGRS